MDYALRMTGRQHAELERHLFPGDGKEAVALLLCGRHAGPSRHIFTAQRVVPVPYSDCVRAETRVTWSTDTLDSVLAQAYDRKIAVVKVHSHPKPWSYFSEFDDSSDATLYRSVASLLDDDLPHASLVMLPGGRMFGRALIGGELEEPLVSVSVIGDDIRIWPESGETLTASFAMRHAQAFGKGTVRALRSLSAAVVGCSGTGSVVVEQLARLDIGRLVLVDPDTVEEKNLNRILNSGKEDAYLRRPKVHVLASSIAHMGLGTEVVTLPSNLITRDAVSAVAGCDIVFGCMDSIEGRHLLNRLATFYVMPYFDVGVRLDADGLGGINSIAGAVHYLQPGRSSLLSRGVYTTKQLEAEEMRRTNPSMYEQQRREGYLRGAQEDRPAVISVNMFFSALAVNDFLARIHPYRNNPNAAYAALPASLSEVQFYAEPEGEPCPLLAPHVGRGDVQPLLSRTDLS